MFGCYYIAKSNICVSSEGGSNMNNYSSSYSRNYSRNYGKSSTRNFNNSYSNRCVKNYSNHNCRDYTRNHSHNYSIINRRVLLRTICIGIALLSMFLVARTCKPHAYAGSNRTLTCTSVLIEENDTLWSIASEYYSEEYGSIQNQIDAIKETNNLSSDYIISGRRIVVPYYS